MSLSLAIAKDVTSVADGELVVSAAAGTEACFEQIVRRYQRPISAYVYRMIGDYDAALDLTQEIFIKVYGSLSRYRSEFKFSTWIYKIAHNSTVAYLRLKAGRERSLVNGTEGDQYDLPVDSGVLSPEQESEQKERRLEIEFVVRSLPATYRELISLRHAQDLTYEEIVEVTALPLGTVKNRLFRAREMMRQQFLNKGITGI